MRGAARRTRVALFLLAAGYFALGWRLTLEWHDEGNLLYDSWRVAEGALPYRDFHHIYGPAVFWLNGALVRWFGADVVVVRASLLVLKALVAVVVYGLARRVATPAFALVAYAIFVATSGSPLYWTAQTPYAVHYQVACSLAAIACFLALRDRFTLGCFVAGVLLGVGATFKQTAGAFWLVAFLGSVVLETDAAEHPRLVGAARAIVALGGAGILLACVSHRFDAWDVAVVVAPLFALFGLVLAAPRRGGTFRARDGVRGAVVAAAGFALPLAACAGIYVAAGALRGLVHDTLFGLPQSLSIFRPFPRPTVREALAGLVLATGIVAVRTARAGWSGRVAAALAAFAVAATLLVRHIATHEGFAVALRPSLGLPTSWVGWQLHPLPTVLFWLPIVTVWGGIVAVARSRERTPALAALTFAAAAGILHLYPWADTAHALAALPPVLPLLAVLLERVHAAPDDRRDAGRLVSGALVALGIAAVCAPFVLRLHAMRAMRPAEAPAIRHAAGIWDPDGHFREIVGIVDALAALEPRDAPLLVLPDEEMVNFLAQRRVALGEETFWLYLHYFGFVSDEELRIHVDEDRAIETLATTRPLVVRRVLMPQLARLRTALPRLVAYVNRGYRRVAAVGGTEIMAPSAP
jgi:hypothetical protein